jgi:hypothetical protein
MAYIHRGATHVARPNVPGVAKVARSTYVHRLPARRLRPHEMHAMRRQAKRTGSGSPKHDRRPIRTTFMDEFEEIDNAARGVAWLFQTWADGHVGGGTESQAGGTNSTERTTKRPLKGRGCACVSMRQCEPVGVRSPTQRPCSNKQNRRTEQRRAVGYDLNSIFAGISQKGELSSRAHHTTRRPVLSVGSPEFKAMRISKRQREMHQSMVIALQWYGVEG